MRSAVATGGLGLAGSLICGTRLPVEGRIRNADLQSQGLGTFSLDFEHEESISDAENFFFVVNVNALPVSEVDPEQGFDSDPMGDGNTQVSVAIRRLSWTTPRFHADPLGRRAVLVWTQVADADAASYALYWDSGTGTVNTTTPMIVLDTTEAQRVDKALPTDGAGTGRVTVRGVYDGPVANATWQIAITGAGTFQYDTGSGLNGTDVDFVAGTNFALPNGLRVIFEDDAADYETGDEFDFAIGPPTLYVTDELDPGTYKFQVGAKDAAGNLGTLSSAASVIIDPAPEAPSGIAATWTPLTRTITLTWTDPEDSDLASVRIYANYHAQAETLLAYVYETAPLDSVAEGVETWSIVVPVGVEGEWLFYVRAVDDEGKEDDNASLVRLDALAVPFSALPAPFLLEAEPVAGGEIGLSWFYDLSEGTPASFNVYTFTTATPTEADYAAATPDSVSNSTPSSEGVIGAALFTTGDLSGLTRYFAVRSVDSGGAETESSNIASATGDGTAPVGVPTLRGVWT